MARIFRVNAGIFAVMSRCDSVTVGPVWQHFQRDRRRGGNGFGRESRLAEFRRERHRETSLRAPQR